MTKFYAEINYESNIVALTIEAPTHAKAWIATMSTINDETEMPLSISVQSEAQMDRQAYLESLNSDNHH